MSDEPKVLWHDVLTTTADGVTHHQRMGPEHVVDDGEDYVVYVPEGRAVTLKVYAPATVDA